MKNLRSIFLKIHCNKPIQYALLKLYTKIRYRAKADRIIHWAFSYSLCTLTDPYEALKIALRSSQPMKELPIGGIISDDRGMIIQSNQTPIADRIIREVKK